MSTVITACVADLIVVGCFREGPSFDAKYVVKRFKSQRVTHEWCLAECKNGVSEFG